MALPTFIDWELVGCCAFVDGRPCDGEPPWETIDVTARDATGRAYSLEISTRVRFDRLVTDDPDGGVDTGAVVPVPGFTSERVSVTTVWEIPHVVVDGPSFDRALVDRLVGAAADVRSLVFAPMLTDDEQAWFDDRDAAVEREQVPAAQLALTLAFGDPWRIEAADAERAASVLIESGFAIEPTPLFSAQPERWSNRARTIIRRRLAANHHH
jgi:hypothetical protein